MYQCKLCDKAYSDPTPLKNHMKTFHTQKGYFECHKCNKIFTHELNLKVHYRKSHVIQDEKVNCKHCGRDVHKYSFKSHMKNHLNRETGALKCDLCLKIFARVETLKKHQLTHTDQVKSFKCDQCDKLYKRNEYLQKHKKFIHEKSEVGKWICKICSKEYSQGGALTIHMRVHKGKQFDCLECDFSSAYKSSVKSHMVTHNKQQKECDICHKMVRAIDLRKHRKRHIEGKSFKCTFCDHQASFMGNLRAHINRKHRGDKSKMSKRYVMDKTLAIKISQTSKDPESSFEAAQNNENSENQPNPFDFMDDSRPLATFRAKPRMLHPHKRQVK